LPSCRGTPYVLCGTELLNRFFGKRGFHAIGRLQEKIDWRRSYFGENGQRAKKKKRKGERGAAKVDRDHPTDETKHLTWKLESDRKNRKEKEYTGALTPDIAQFGKRLTLNRKRM